MDLSPLRPNLRSNAVREEHGDSVNDESTHSEVWNYCPMSES